MIDVMWPEFEPIVEKARRSTRLDELPLGTMRQAMNSALIRWAGTGTSGCTTRILLIPAPTGEVRVELYTPAGDTGIRPLIVVYHGGGFVLGSIATQEVLGQLIAADTGSVVASVDYRLAPENPYPAAVEDGVTAYLWLRENAAAFGSASDRVALWGESAGGTVAAATALMARQQGIPPKAVFLAYPPLCAKMDTKSWSVLGDGYWLTRPTMAWFWRQYLGATKQCMAEFAEPLHAASLDEMPGTLMITGGLDPLRDENEAYAIRLADAGSAVKHHIVPGAIHGFLSMPTVSVRARGLLRDYCYRFAAMLR